jgi:hypothetical protein
MSAFDEGKKNEGVGGGMYYIVFFLFHLHDKTHIE